MLKHLNKLIRGEVAVGFYLSTFFWVAALGWVTSYVPTDFEKQECQKAAQTNGGKIENCKTFWERTTSDPVAFFAFGTFVFTGVLAISTGFLWRSTRDAAIAAHIAAKHIPRVERAYLFGGPFKFVINKATRRTDYSMTVDNAGKTPGIIQEICVAHGLALPSKSPSYPNARMLSSDMVINAGDRGFEITKDFFVPSMMPFFIYGYIRYIDVFKDPHTSRFCMRIVPTNDPKTTGVELAGGRDWNDWD
jgi:hypothetical protein